MGKFIYLTHTRPNISYVISVHNSSDPTNECCELYSSISNTFITLGKGIMFFKHGYLYIMGYIDSNFVSFKYHALHYDLKSLLGYVFFSNNITPIEIANNLAENNLNFSVIKIF